MTRIAFIGLGALGSRMACSLVNAGHEVTVWNRTWAKVDQLAARGAMPAATPAEAASRAEVVMTMLATPAALQAVTDGPAGIAVGIGGSATMIEMSTVGPASVLRLASALPNEVDLLDAPVLGSIAEAESGTLSIFVGGPAPVVGRWMPLLTILGTPLHVGPLGMGAVAKLMANSTLFGVLGLLGEAIALARGLSLSDAAVFKVLAATPLAAQAERRRLAIESGEYPPRFPLALARKDIDLVIEAAAAAGVEMRLARATQTWLADADDAGWSNQDYTIMLARILGAH
ncbi:MAG TPA: NAD(P)-dependent oxidoreductase [Ktedonobacterales bacterium]|jgi:3-hydroxyisobutyrate dehydrogenase-like beta-hydroxyacid dehydrogenase|nr:NAD(P)-dependent oxidoreductase [Ktedonobacterales bacterium]